MTQIYISSLRRTKMHRLVFSATIRAPKDEVWRALFADETYRQWTSVFAEGSYADTDWKVGSKALFLTPGGDGMVSRIAVHRPNEFLSIQHLGTVKGGVEDTGNDKGWAGALENYTLQEEGDYSKLTVEMDTTEEYRTYMEETWPKALSKLTEIVEAKQRSEQEAVRQTA